MPRRRKAQREEPATRPPDREEAYAAAVDMLNSIRVLGPDMKPDELKTRAERARQFAKVKHIIEGYEFCDESGRVVRVR